MTRGAATSSGIVPRWEWRTFGEHFGDAETRFAALSPERVGESDEVYLLSTEGTDTVKVLPQQGLIATSYDDRITTGASNDWIRAGDIKPGDVIEVSIGSYDLDHHAPRQHGRSAWRSA